MYWEWIFADTGEAAHQIEIEIERIMPVADVPMTELELMKSAIQDDGAPLIEAYKQVDLEAMEREGQVNLAVQIRAVLALVDSIQMAIADD